MENVTTLVTVRKGKKYTYQINNDGATEINPDQKTTNFFNSASKIWILEAKKNAKKKGNKLICTLQYVLIDETTPEEQAKIDADRKAKAETAAAKKEKTSKKPQK